MTEAREREATTAAYRERNQLVALLSTLFPSGKATTAIDGWDEAWHGCVYIDFPWGQASWHYHTDDAWMFAHLPPYTKPWDGHTTKAKYAAIAASIRARGEAATELRRLHAEVERLREAIALLKEARDFIDTTRKPRYPAGADLADRIDALRAALGDDK
jgi:hypothetical protein